MGIKEIDFSGKTVLVRGDFDVDFTHAEDNIRISSIVPTIKLLQEKRAKIVLIGHRGRPNGYDPELSLKTVSEKLSSEMSFPIIFQDNIFTLDAKNAIKNLKEGGVVMLENLRFDPGEERNDADFAAKLSELGDFFVNESFATSHRMHASIVALPKLLPSCLGLRFEKEIENLKHILNPERPLIAIVSGTKEDKIIYAKKLQLLCDKVLVGGKLPQMMDIDKSVTSYTEEDKLVVANLNIDKGDITLNSIDVFKKVISRAKTILLAGVLGIYEDPGHRQGTKEIFEAVANSNAYKLVGGGDSLVAIEAFNLKDKFDWISVGGGAMIYFLTEKTLPGIEAISSK